MYAKDTKVGVDTTRIDIEKLVTKHGASHFCCGYSPKSAFVQFAMKDRYVKFNVPIPDENTRDGRGWIVSKEKRDQMTRAKWRGLLLVIKAKLEAVEAGIMDFETEFMAQIILPDGSTVGQFMKPQIADAYQNRKMPLLLAGGD